MKTLLKKLSDSFDQEASKISDYITNNGKYCSEFFECPAIFHSLDTRPRSLWGKGGIYIFVITKEIELSKAEVFCWNTVGGAGFPNVKSKKLVVGDCLYLGSAESIYKRMPPHFGDTTTTGTGLKLCHNNRKKLKDSITVYAFPLKEELKEYSHIVNREIEKRLHRLLQPKAGSSRV